jgi:hypothetical protein
MSNINNFKEFLARVQPKLPRYIFYMSIPLVLHTVYRFKKQRNYAIMENETKALIKSRQKNGV